MAVSVVSLIKKGLFQDALDLLSQDEKNSNSQVFLTSYCHYRLEDFEKALETITTFSLAAENDIPLTSLKAQILFKLEKFKESSALYERLMKLCPERNFEWSSNYSASQSMARVSFESKAKVYHPKYIFMCSKL